MQFPEEPPAQQLAQEFGALVDECFDLGNRDLTLTWIPSFVLALALASLVLAATQSAPLYLTLPLFVVTLLVAWGTLWCSLAWIVRTFFTRRLLHQRCQAINTLATRRHVSHERMRALWDRAWTIRGATGRLRFMEARAEHAILREFPWLASEAPAKDCNWPMRPA